ncbi:STAS/SEC14 domain-containing protein [Shewanella sp. 3B26]|jgi:hypothetical protein|uniref:STAS/SEC14 domain-containing protein n=1 Tax=Shewanella zhuhaiensis TaxID=2919576 RepID=A0AAJ1BG87_9GAMM|nr:STAS/SEC14 domain-containing protein [Shewanella zhuhaiensis]MCH4294251.1 STAS/SEC14 domain-containing protein [Shewanella zhuhaiensis]
MISIETGFEHDTLAVRASGVISPEDYTEVLVPALEARLRDHASVRLWYQIDDKCRGMRLSSLWQDFLLGVFHLDDFRCVAIVTDRPLFRRMGEIMAIFLPCPVKVFAQEQQQHAREWLAQKG